MEGGRVAELLARDAERVGAGEIPEASCLGDRGDPPGLAHHRRCVVIPSTVAPFVTLADRVRELRQYKLVVRSLRAHGFDAVRFFFADPTTRAAQAVTVLDLVRETDGPEAAEALDAALVSVLELSLAGRRCRPRARSKRSGAHADDRVRVHAHDDVPPAAHGGAVALGALLVRDLPVDRAQEFEKHRAPATARTTAR